MNPSQGGPSSGQIMQAVNGTSGAFGNVPTSGGVVLCSNQKLRALEVGVFDEADRPIDGQVVDLGLGQEVYRLTTSGGAVRFEGLLDDTYTLTLPDLDQTVWDVAVVSKLPSELIFSNGSSDFKQVPPLSLGEGTIKVEPGQGTDKIAVKLGHLPATIWDHGNNAGLRARSLRQNTLIPTDSVFIPARTPKKISALAGGRYVLRRKGLFSLLRLRFEIALQPLDGVPYQIEVPGYKVFAGQAQGGIVTLTVPASTAGVKVTLSIQGEAVSMDLPVDTLFPLTHDAGVTQRLRNLGVPCDPTDGSLDPPAEAALRRFQENIDLPPTGKIDDPLRAYIFTRHDKE